MKTEQASKPAVSRVTVKRNSDTGEWMAVVYRGNVRDEAATYYTDDKKDAEATAFLMKKDYGLFNAAA